MVKLTRYIGWSTGSIVILELFKRNSYVFHLKITNLRNAAIRNNLWFFLYHSFSNGCLYLHNPTQNLTSCHNLDTSVVGLCPVVTHCVLPRCPCDLQTMVGNKYRAPTCTHAIYHHGLSDMHWCCLEPLHPPISFPKEATSFTFINNHENEAGRGGSGIIFRGK
jgi:hypothetical protein